MRRLLTILMVVAVSVAFFSCNKNNSLEQLRKNELKRLDEFINENYPGEEPYRSGLYYFEKVKGTGDTVG